jgi:hypothetical protein
LNRFAIAVVIILIAVGAALAGNLLKVVEDGGGGTEFAFFEGYITDMETTLAIGGASIRACQYISGDPAGNPSGPCVSTGTYSNGYYIIGLTPGKAYGFTFAKVGYNSYITVRTTGPASTIPAPWNVALSKVASSGDGPSGVPLGETTGIPAGEESGGAGESLSPNLLIGLVLIAAAVILFFVGVRR